MSLDMDAPLRPLCGREIHEAHIRGEPLDALDGGEQQVEREQDQIHIGHGDREVARQHDAAVNEAVEQIEQGDVLVVTSRQAHGAASSPASLAGTAKLYGGQGPLCSQRTPSRAPMASSSSMNVADASRRTRYAARSTSTSTSGASDRRGGIVARSSSA